LFRQLSRCDELLPEALMLFGLQDSRWRIRHLLEMISTAKEITVSQIWDEQFSCSA
jgi:hypothetical protein